MELKELKEFVHLENQRLNRLFSLNNDKATLVKAVKLTEEIGELNEQVLHSLSIGRKEKLEHETNQKEHMAEEVADVLICTMLLADHLGIDAEHALEKKMEKINRRYE